MKGLRAKDESRTRDLNLGKVALYQLSYFRLYFQFFWSRTPTKIRPLADCALLPIAIGKLLSLLKLAFANLFMLSILEPIFARWRM